VHVITLHHIEKPAPTNLSGDLKLKHRAGRAQGYHITPAAALPLPEIGRRLGAALRASYRGGRWFESTAAHQVTLCLPDALNVPVTRPDH
jgi:hypothetical protein